MKFEKLGDIVKITSGGTPLTSKREYYSEGTIPWVKTGDLKVKDLLVASDYITELGLQNSSAKFFPKNTVLIAMYGATIGACSILKFEATTNQACAALLPSEKINHDYLYFYLRSIKSDLIKKGVGGGQPNISATILKDTKILIPETIDDQIRIADLLSRAEALIAQRKESIQYLDDFLKSTFLEMFGDPVKNEKGWEVKTITQVGETRLGKMLDKSKIIGNNLKPYLRNSNVLWFKFKLNDLLEMDFDEKDKREFSLKYGDILMCEGGEIGRCAIWKKEKEDCYFQKAIHRIRLRSNKAVPEYFVHLMWNYSIGGGLKQFMGASTIAHLTGENLKKLKLSYPPIELQQKFAQIVEKAEGIKKQYQASLSELEQLYAALSQKAFRGELKISGVLPIARPSIETETELNIQATTETVRPKPAPKTKKTMFEMSQGVLGKITGIPFNIQEGEAAIKQLYEKKGLPFSFDELIDFAEKNKFKCTQEEVSDVVMELLAQKKLQQLYASKEWMESMKEISETDEEFKGEGTIWFTYQSQP